MELIAGVYGCLSIRAFYKRSKLNEIHNDLNPDRYIRLISFSAVDLLCGIPVTVYYLFANIKDLDPFPGLKQEHSDISQIIQIPAAVWRADTLGELSIELNRWITVFVAFVFFAIFGFTKESRDSYRAMFQSVVQVFVKITGIKIRPSSDAEGCVAFFFSRFSSDIHNRIRYLESYSTTPGGRVVLYSSEDDLDSYSNTTYWGLQTVLCIVCIVFFFLVTPIRFDNRQWTQIICTQLNVPPDILDNEL